jgi:RNA polymerase sigma-70 factor (ECF subfamily)
MPSTSKAVRSVAQGNLEPLTRQSRPTQGLALNDPAAEIVKKCQTASGSEFQEAYRELFVLFQDRVFTVCFRVTGNRHDALDAAQEAMVAVLRRIHGFEFRSKFSSWVYRIAVNAAIDVRRRRTDAPRGGVRTLLGTEPGEELSQGSDAPAQVEPSSQLARTETQEAVRDALTRINPKFSALLVLRYIEELSYEAIAEVQECSLGTVKSRLNRAHAALRSFLEGHGGADL